MYNMGNRFYCLAAIFCLFVEQSLAVAVRFKDCEGQVTNVTASVHGIIEGIPMPFPLPNPNGCVNSGLKCPLVAQSNVEYVQSLEVKAIYPSLSVTVEWELKDEKGKDLTCGKFKAHISD